MSKADYEILSYRVMWKRHELDNWSFTDCSTEENAIEHLKDCLSCNFIAKVLQIQVLCDFYE